MKVPFRLTVLGVALMCAAVPPAPAQLIVEDIVNVRFQPDVRVFAVMAALNAAGFDTDAGANELAENPTRRLVREHLAAIPQELRVRLRDFYAAAAGETEPVLRQGRFISYALLLNGPPSFRLPFKAEEVPEEARAAIGFEKLVAELWRQAGLATVWSKVTPQYVAEIESYRPIIRDMIVGVLRYARTEARIALDREVTFIPDLLNAYGVVNGRNISSTYVVVVGPSRAREVPLRSVRHEYLHFLLDPLVAKYWSRVPDPAPFLARVGELPAAWPRYRSDFNMVLTESLIRALELRLAADAGNEATARLVELYDQGLILAPNFYEAFGRFETRSEPLNACFPELIAGLTWEREAGRAESVAHLRAEAAARSARATLPAPDEDPARKEIRALLVEGNRLLQARSFERAAEVLQRALGLDPGNAAVLFGLGQASMQLQDFEHALDYYSKAAAAASPGEAWVAAWSYVYRGNVFRFLDEPEKAKVEWNRALQLAGDLRGAADAATKALASR